MRLLLSVTPECHVMINAYGNTTQRVKYFDQYISHTIHFCFVTNISALLNLFIESFSFGKSQYKCNTRLCI